MRSSPLILSVLLVLSQGLVAPATSELQAGDWPTWRHNAGRTACTPQKLSDKLRLAWMRQSAPPSAAWPEDPRLLFDAAGEPIVVGKTLWLVSNSDDSITAVDTDSGREKWRFFAEGPMRLAPVVANDKLYAGADDGAVYCLSAKDGKLVWKIPSPWGKRTAIGNDRLISLWPVRGGPVIHHGWLYYTAGVWPFEGAALFRVDLSKADALGPGDQPPIEVITTFGEDSPQGYLAVCGETLFVPCGRGPAVCINLQGTPAKIANFGADMKTDYHLSANGQWLFHGQRVMDFQSRRQLPLECPHPVSQGSNIYFVQKNHIVATDLSKTTLSEQKDRRGQPMVSYAALWKIPKEAIRAAIAPQETVPRIDGPLVVDLLAGDRVLGHWGNVLFAIQPPLKANPARVVWTTVIDGTPASLIAADDKLFVSTREGKLLCFADYQGAPIPVSVSAATSQAGPSPFSTKVADLLRVSGAKAGYCILWGIGDGTQIDELVRQSDLRLVVIDSDADKVAALRWRMAAAGKYGSRVSARVGDANSIELPPYLANLVFRGDAKRVGLDSVESIVSRVLPTLRPYGGTACLELTTSVHDKLAQLVAAQPATGARVDRREGFSLLQRPGALPGAADWTHEYADGANTLMSQDKLVASPLGALWFGGPASDPSFFFNRHYWPPSPVIVGGRMYLQGPSTLAAIDIYTGRVMWRVPIDEGSSPGRRGNFYEGDEHTGHHMAGAEDALYLCYLTSCLRIDPVTGRTLAKFHLPEKTARWGEIHILQNLLLVSVFDPQVHDGKMPARLVALDRISGEPAWTHTPTQGCPLVAMGAGKVFFYDGLLPGLYNDLNRRGEVPKGNPQRYLKALDARTGKLLWQQPIDMVATWLAHSAKNDVLVASNHEGLEARQGERGESLWRKSAKSVGFKGHPESRWDRLILWNDRIIDQRGPGLSYELKTGKLITRPHPITGDAVPWEFTTTAHNCAYAIASQNMLTFRDGTAGYCNVADGMTSRLPGFRSGCRSSLIPAGGVLNAPNMAHGCDCGFSVFTSLALVHVPEAETWSYSPLKPPAGRVRRLGMNLGAPGDRLAPDGTLWLDWSGSNQPNNVLTRAAEPSPDVDVRMEADNPRWYRLPTGLMHGAGPHWVGASGVEGIRSFTVPLGGNGKVSGEYVVRLVFAEPADCGPGQRVFDVAVNGSPVLTDFDLNEATGGRYRVIVKEFPNITATDAVRIDLKAKAGRTLLCGIEIVVAEPK